MSKNSYTAKDLPVLPVSGRHAIEVMSLAVEWGRPADPEFMAQIQEIYNNTPALQEFLPKQEAMQGVTVLVDNNGPSISSGPSGGFQWLQVKSDGAPEWVVHVRPELLSVSCFNYDRWNTVKPSALQVLEPIVALAMKSGYPIQAVGVQYQDAVRVQSPSPRDCTRRLLQQGSPWLTSRVWDDDRPWHIHQGWFSVGNESRLVHNLLNLDLLREPDSCLFRVNGQHRMLSVSSETDEALPLSGGDVSAALDRLHMDNKRALFDLLADSVKEQIGLTVMETL